MVRNFDPDRAVAGAARDRLLAAALRAPSAGFTQGAEFLVLEHEADRARFWGAAGGEARRTGRWMTGMCRAPLLIVCFSHRQAYVDRYREPDKHAGALGDRWPVAYWDIDAGFAALLLLLDAVDQGLGACFFGVPAGHVQQVRDAFGVPPGFTPVGVVAVGHPAPDHRSASLARPRRGVADVAHFGTW